MTKNKEIEKSPVFGDRKNQSGDWRKKMARVGRVGPCPFWRVGARAASKKISKNMSTSVTSSDTYADNERIQGRHGGYDPSTYE
ncbi:hypothetical protein ACFX1R_042358 [Malus domestica]